MATTRAMRHLAPDPVPDELIRTVIEAATWAPSAGNAQVASYVVVTDRGTMARLAVLWTRVIDDYRLLEAAVGLDTQTDASSARIRAACDYQRDHFAETPALIVVCQEPTPIRSGRAVAALVSRVGPRRAVGILRGMSRARRTLGASIYPGVQNLLLASRAYGLAACFTCWHLLAEDEFKAIIGIPRNVTTWGAIPIGWPLRSFGPVRRRPVDDVLHREHW